MPLATDSYMGIFLPADIGRRIIGFMASRTEFPFVGPDEVMATFHLLGKSHGVDAGEVSQAADLAKKTAERLVSDIRLYRASPAKMNPALTRQNYHKRSLQIVVDLKGDLSEVNERVAGDPAILADCFAQHVAHYKKDFFFELFGPLKSEELPKRVADRLAGRMVLLGYNSGDRKQIPFASPLEPFFDFVERS